MQFLFIHQNFPGQFLHLVRHLVAARKHEIVFITQPNANEIPGVRKVPYRRPDPPPGDTHWTVKEFETASRRAEAVARTAASLKGLGFQPDIIIGHHGWGELLHIGDVWPGVPLLGYYEFFYHTDGIDVGFDPEFPANLADFPRIRAKNAVNLLALNLGAHGQTPTAWQLSTYPEWAYEQITLLPEGVNLELCKPQPELRREPLRIGETEIAPTDKLVTYVARDLEPYRGFHIMMRALPHLLGARKDVRVVMVGGDGVSYGAAPQGTTWRAIMQKEMAGKFDAEPRAVPRADRLPHLSADAAALGRACVSDLPVRRLLVAAGSPGRRLRDRRQRHRAGARVHTTQPQRPAYLVLRPPRACRFRVVAAGGRGALPPSARRRAALRGAEPRNGGVYRRLRGPDRQARRSDGTENSSPKRGGFASMTVAALV